MTDNDVDILDAETYEVVRRCPGPVGNACGLTTGVVACAGYRISPANAGPEYNLLWVPPGTYQCPLAWNLEAVGL
jgi:hypothetical protein